MVVEGRFIEYNGIGGEKLGSWENVGGICGEVGRRD